MKLNSFFSLIALAVLALVLNSCSSSTYTTRKIAWTDMHSFTNREGTLYCLPKGYIHIVADLQTQTATNAGAAKKPSYKISTLESVLMPDIAHAYLLDPKASAWAHDRFGIGVANGLLTSINSSNVDQTSQVLVKIGALAGDILYLSGGGGKGPATAPPTNTLPEHIDLYSDASELRDITNILSDEVLHAARLKVTVTRSSLYASGTDDETGLWNLSADAGEGLFYRPLLPCQVKIDDGNNGNEESAVVMLPDFSPIFKLVPRRTPMATASTSITFDRGCPIGFTYDRESPALGWAELPLDIIKAVLSAPTDLIQLKFNFANTNAQLAAAQNTEVENQLKLLQAQLGLQQYMQTNNLH
ncbi:MAG TPA: hypothetical protein VGO57_15285 [Verrucomicrobiae bacterium]|jgi:hypothetical protein